MRYREYILDIPMELDARIGATLEKIQLMGLAPSEVTPRRFMESVLLLNGLAVVEADIKNRDMSSRLVWTSEEAEMASKQLKRMRV